LPDTPPPAFDYSGARHSSLLMRFWGNSALYAVTGLLTRLGNFILLPVYWSRLAPEDFGALAIAEILSLGLMGILTLCLEGAVTRFYHEWSPEDRPKNLAAVWVASLVGSIVLSALVYGAAALAWNLAIRQVPFRPLIELAILAALARSFSSIPFALLRVREQLHLYSLMNVLSFGANAIAGIYLVCFAGWGAPGVLTGTVAGYGAAALIWILFMSRQISLPFSRRHLVPSLAFCAPLIPASLISYAGSLCDRFFLDRFAPLAQVGLYAVAGRLATVVKEGNQALKNSWIPFATRVAIERPDAPAVIGRLAKYYVGALIGASLAVALLGREFVLLFASTRYAPAVAFMPVLVAAAAFDVIDVLSGVGLSIRKSTRSILALTAMEAAITLISVGLLTAAYGAVGAMWGVLVSRGTSTLVKLAVSSRHYPAKYEFGQWLGLLLLAAGSFAGAQFLPAMSPWLSAAIKLAILAAYAALASVLFLDIRRGLEIIRAPSPSTNPPA
jgi:O-antigen/teichoic acid export membrane protein